MPTSTDSTTATPGAGFDAEAVEDLSDEGYLTTGS